MRFLSYQEGAKARPAVLIDEQNALDIRMAGEASGANVYRSVLAVIEAGQRGLDDIATLLLNPVEDAVRPVDELAFLSPLPVPQQIRDFANYEGHCLAAMDASMRLRTSGADDPDAAYDALKASGAYRLPPVWYDIPLYYKGNRFATNGHNGVVDWPAFSEFPDYELELACIVGRKGKDIGRHDARDHIFGYTIFNDFSARDVQAKWEGQFRMGPAKGKDFDGSNAFGPWIVTQDEIADPYDLSMSVRINGKEQCVGSSGGAQHDFEACIEQVSRSETIFPGEIFGLGTIPGGCGFESLTRLDDGDVVELEIEGIGVLRNTVRRT